MIDQRIRMAADLYDPCSLGADIGCDHGLLPCHLLRQGICDRMICADLSEKALQHARSNIHMRDLDSRAIFVCADGFDALRAVPDAPGCVSLMGVGGRVARNILLKGADLLRGATLILSVHRDVPLGRQALQEIGYQICEERLCLENGRFYILWKARPGSMQLTQEEMLLGTKLFDEDDAVLLPYLRRRISILEKQCAASPENDADTARFELQCLRSRLGALLSR
ncbi:MAG: SAM-dependent methyltransferase [Clostridia bacterium]|nr:SAM-dependent methyltransferase [Clostridia bacterium]